MKKIIRFIILFLLIGFGIFLQGQRLAILKELAKPTNLLIDGQILLISDETNQLHLYSFKNFKHIAQLCRSGEGPGEAQYVGRVILNKEYIFRYIQGKNIYYSRDGKFQKEFKTRGIRNLFFYPIGKKFVNQQSVRKNGNEDSSNEISLFTFSPDEGMKFEKLLYWFKYKPITWKGARRPYRFFYDNHEVVIFEDKIFIGDSMRGLFVQCFDKDGKNISQVKLEIEKTKFPDWYENDLKIQLKNNGQWDLFNNQFYFEHPDYYPDFYQFFVGKNKIYFLTFVRKGDQREVVITDWHGKLIKKSYIPWVHFPYERNFTIFEDKFYWLVDNQDTEEWELHVTDVK